MRTLVTLALAAAALAGCADDRDRTQAALQCQQVGITASSNEYGSCVSAYTSMRREGVLNTAFRDMVNPIPPDPRRPHQDQIF